MRFSVFSLPITPGAEDDTSTLRFVEEFALRCDEAGFAATYFAEHHFSDYSGYGNNFLMAASLARQLRQMYLGFAVSVVPLHHPVRLAEQVNLLDQLCEGRFLFGFGSGGIPTESRGFGADPHTQGQHTEELVELIFRLWAKDMDDPPIEFDVGGYRGVLAERIMPTSFRQPRPLLKRPGMSPGGYDQAVRWGTSIFLMSGGPGTQPAEAGAQPPDPVEVLGERIRQFEADLRAAGHDDAVVAECLRWTGPNSGCFVGETDEDALAHVSAQGETYRDWLGRSLDLGGVDRSITPFWDESVPIPRRSASEGFEFMGSPETVTATLKRYEAVGLEEVTFMMNGGRATPERQAAHLRSLQLFVDEVMPQFKED